MWNKKLIVFFILGLLFFCVNRKLKINDPNYFYFDITYNNLLRKNLLYYPGNYENINSSLVENVQLFPLIISLHGGGGNIESNLKLSKGRLIELKEKYHYFLLLPEGYDHHWNDGRNESISKAHANNIDDAGYIKYLITFLKKNYPIDENKVFIFGISNGGMMAFRFACEYSESIAGFASISATMPQNLKNNCNINKTLKMILIHGTEDPLVPFNGGEVKVLFRKRGLVLSAEQTIQFWLNKNSCNFNPAKEILNKDPSTPTEILHYSCKDQTFVRFYKVLYGGHTWPGGLQYLPSFYIGKTTYNFSAEEEIIKFFLN